MSFNLKFSSLYHTKKNMNEKPIASPSLILDTFFYSYLMLIERNEFFRKKRF